MRAWTLNRSPTRMDVGSGPTATEQQRGKKGWGQPQNWLITGDPVRKCGTGAPEYELAAGHRGGFSR